MILWQTFSRMIAVKKSFLQNFFDLSHSSSSLSRPLNFVTSLIDRLRHSSVHKFKQKLPLRAAVELKHLKILTPRLKR